MLPQEFILQVIQANPIESVAGSYVQLTRTGSKLKCKCPFHPDSTPSCVLYPENNSFYCFGCHVGGSVITFVQNIESLSFPEAVKYLADRAGINLPEAEETPEERQLSSFKSKVMECLKSAAVFYYKRLYSPEGKHGLDYLRNRGLTDETIKSFGLGYSGKGYDQAVSYLRSKGFPDKVIDAAYAKVEADRTEMIQRLRSLDILSGDPLAFFDALLEAEDFDTPDTDIIGKKFMFAVYLELWQEILGYSRSY